MLNNEQILQIRNRTKHGELTVEEQAIYYIYDDLENVKNNFIDIGFRLYEANNYKYYEKFGYESIVDFAEHLFGLKKSTTYSLMNVYARFGSRMKLLPEYKKYSQSQLTEMCSLPEYLVKYVTADMTVQDIKDYKKAYNELTHWNEDTVKNAKKLIEDYRNSKTEDSRRLENEKIENTEIGNYEVKNFGSVYSPFPTPNYIVQWRHGGEIHNYAYMLFTDVVKVLKTFDKNTDYRVIQIDINHVKALVFNKE